MPDSKGAEALGGLLALCPLEVLQQEILSNLAINKRLLISLCSRELCGSELLWKDLTSMTIHMTPNSEPSNFPEDLVPFDIGLRLLRFVPKLSTLGISSAAHGVEWLTMSKLKELLRQLPNLPALVTLDLYKSQPNFTGDVEIEPELLRLLSGVKRVLLNIEYCSWSSNIWLRLAPLLSNLEVILFPMRIEGRTVRSFDLAGIHEWIKQSIVFDMSPNAALSWPESLLGKSWFSFWNLLCVGSIMPSQLSILHVACAIANVDTVKQLIETLHIQDLNQQLETDLAFAFTPLHMAIGCSNIEVIKYIVSLPQVDLFNRKCAPNIYRDGGANALMLAAGLHEADTLKVLLDCSIKNKRLAECYYDLLYLAQHDVFRQAGTDYSARQGQNESFVPATFKKTFTINVASRAATLELLMKYMPQVNLTIQTTRQASTGRSLMFTATSEEWIRTFLGAGLSLYDQDYFGLSAVVPLAEYAARNAQGLAAMKQLILDGLIQPPEPDSPEIRAFIRLIYSVTSQVFPLLDWRQAVMDRASLDDLNQTWAGRYSWETERSVLYSCVSNREPGEVIEYYLQRGAKATRAICSFLSDYSKELVQTAISDNLWLDKVDRIMPFWTVDLSYDPLHSNGNHGLVPYYALFLLCHSLWKLPKDHPRYDDMYDLVGAAVGYLKRAQAPDPVIFALRNLPQRYSELPSDLKELLDQMVEIQLAAERSSGYNQDEECIFAFLEDQAAL